ncbi:MAG TPA: SpoIIE family protein phosphatase [Anaeromyxobacter sp.]|nr:SpoIIE family protein phosphatase [Anaeromyxobacter sp.]
MIAAGQGGEALLDWGAAGAALGRESGDVPLVAPFPGGVLVALVDGLGHGIEAAEAARAAVRTLAAGAGGPVAELVERCHRALRGTRGAVMTVASFEAGPGAMTWVGVGNVEGVLVRAGPAAPSPREVIVARGGVVGYQLPALRPSTLPVAPGDTLVLASDGIHGSFIDAIPVHLGPQALADAILARHARGTDDAQVVVARYRGAGEGQGGLGVTGAAPEREAIRIPIRAEWDVAEARARARELAEREGFRAGGIGAIATAVSEVAWNIVEHAGSGEVRLEPVREGVRRGIRVVAVDQAEGIRDLELALSDGGSTGKGLGLGLPGARRLMDGFSVVSARGEGTTVTMEKWVGDDG